MKKLLIKIILCVLIKVMSVVYIKDEGMREIIKNLSTDIEINIKVLGTNICKKIDITNNEIKSVKKSNNKEKIIIEFKHINAAFNTVIGRTTIKNLYIDKMITVKGNLSDSVIMMEAVNLTEAYILPDFINKKIFEISPNRSMSRFNILKGLIVGK